MSKISNLRAMFEQNQNQDNSPPSDRGRSPVGSIGGASNGNSMSHSPRPLSKVRTSFVTVERSGQMGNQLGLKRDPSGEPSLSKRRTSFSIDEEEHPHTIAERKQSVATELTARKQSATIEDTIPEVSVMTPSGTSKTEENKPLATPSGKQRTTETAKPTKSEDKKPTNGAPLNGHTNGASKPTTAKVVEKPAAIKTITKPSPISTAKTIAQSKTSPKKSPLPNPPTTPNKPRTRDASTNTPERRIEVEKKPERKSSRASLPSNQTARASSRPPTTAANGSAPKTRIPASPPQTGFHKPRPKSPTKPVKLPASLTAHTASSGSKTANAPPPSRQSLSRASGNITSGSTRSPSRATVTSKTNGARNPATLKSATHRPSLGPPPKDLKKQPSRPNLSQNTAPADEGFLARMMRPTTSSASKTAEKAPATPPKRSQSLKRPATRDGTSKENGSPVPKVYKEASTKAVAKPASKAAESKKVKEEGQLTPKETVAKEAPNTSVTAPMEEKVEISVKAEDAEVMVVEEPTVEHPVIVEDVKEDSATEEEVILSEPEAAPVDEAIEEAVEVPEAIEEESIVEKEEIQAPEAPKDEPVILAALEAEVTQEQIKTEETIPAEASAKQAASVEAEEEDPEDAKAREEIAKLNAEFAKVSLEDDAETKA